MGLDILLQLRQAAVSLAAGAVAGLVYDFFAVLRKDTGVPGAMVLDSLFCLLMGAGLFVIGYGPGQGELRLFMLAFLLGGMALYFVLLGGRTRRIMTRIYALAARGVAYILRPLKKLHHFLKKVKNFAKKLFQKLKKWYTLYYRIIIPAENGRKDEGKHYETQKSGLDNQDSRFGFDSIPDTVSYRYAWPDSPGQVGQGSYGGGGKEPRGG